MVTLSEHNLLDCNVESLQKRYPGLGWNVEELPKAKRLVDDKTALIARAEIGTGGLGERFTLVALENVGQADLNLQWGGRVITLEGALNRPNQPPHTSVSQPLTPEGSQPVRAEWWVGFIASRPHEPPVMSPRP